MVVTDYTGKHTDSSGFYIVYSLLKKLSIHDDGLAEECGKYFRIGELWYLGALAQATRTRTYLYIYLGIFLKKYKVSDVMDAYRT